MVKKTDPITPGEKGRVPRRLTGTVIYQSGGLPCSP